jgi:uncharacterized protein
MNPSSSQSLCLTCGLCCDGTLFSFVPLKPDDEIAALETVGINIVSGSVPNIFKQPCAALRACTCIVYENRPENCRTYKCELLKRFERDDISYDAALKIIKKAVSLKNQVRALAVAASTSTQRSEEVQVLIKLALQIHLDRFFREKPIIQAVAPGTAKASRHDLT